MPDGLRNDQEYSTQDTRRAHEELKTRAQLGLRSVDQNALMVPRRICQGSMRRRTVAAIDRQHPEARQDRRTQIVLFVLGEKR